MATGRIIAPSRPPDPRTLIANTHSIVSAILRRVQALESELEDQGKLLRRIEAKMEILMEGRNG